MPDGAMLGRLRRGGAGRPDLERVIGEYVESPRGLRHRPDDRRVTLTAEDGERRREPDRLRGAAHEDAVAVAAHALIFVCERAAGVRLKWIGAVRRIRELRRIPIEQVAGEVDAVIDE